MRGSRTTGGVGPWEDLWAVTSFQPGEHRTPVGRLVWAALASGEARFHGTRLGAFELPWPSLEVA